MPRGAAVVYPKDAAQIVAMADIFPGARVVEAGVGSGALTCSLLRAVGPHGRVLVVRAPRGVRRRRPRATSPSSSAATTRRGSCASATSPRRCPRPASSVDRVDPGHARPWECLDAVADALRARRHRRARYVATTTQLSRVVETLRAHGGFTEPQAWESLVRDWHVEGLAVRPGHRMIGHTGVPGHRPPDGAGAAPPLQAAAGPRPGAYGPDYAGPRPPGVPPRTRPRS